MLAALGPDVVAHLGTASKLLTPTLGVGWLVAPPALRADLLARRAATAMRPARAGQRVLAALASSGDLSRHLRRLRREMAGRRELVRATVLAAGYAVEGDPAGAHVLVPLDDVAAEEALVAAAAPLGVALDWLGRHHLADVPGRRAGLVLGFAAPTRAELDRALRVLATVLRAAGRGSGEQEDQAGQGRGGHGQPQQHAERTPSAPSVGPPP